MDFANNKPGACANKLTGPSTTNDFDADSTPWNPDAVKTDLLSRLSRRIWVLNYSLEEARQCYAGRRQFVREACACIALALLSLGGARYV